MITWVTVWVLTATYSPTTGARSVSTTSYQLTYATQQACIKQLAKHKTDIRAARCDFQQIPVVTK